MIDIENVRVQIAEKVATITIDNPPANALNSAVMSELSRALDEIVKNDEVKVCVITGAGMAFIAGADIKEISEVKSAQEGTKLSSQGQAIINKIENMDKPVIAAINGWCLGGGLELAMACHIRICSERAKLGQPEINLGIIPGFGGTQRFTRLTNLSKAYEAILTGEFISPVDAKQMGLVNRVVPETDVLKEAQGMAKKIASKGKLAIAAGMKAVRDGRKLSLEQGLALEADLFGKVCATEDMKEGLSAFLQKRQPQFKDK